MSQLLPHGPRPWLLPLGPSMLLGGLPLLLPRPRLPPVHLCLLLHRHPSRHPRPLHRRRVPNPRLLPRRRHLSPIAPALALLGITATRRRRRALAAVAVAVAAVTAIEEIVTATDIVNESVTVTVTVIAVNTQIRILPCIEGPFVCRHQVYTSVKLI